MILQSHRIFGPFFSLLIPVVISAQPVARIRIRDAGVKVGVMAAGQWNAITDVQGVKVGHVTIAKGDEIRTGVTAILPHGDNIFQQKVPAAVYVGNGFGKLAGALQVQELGNLETPVILTNTLSVSAAIEGVVDYTLAQKGNEGVRSVNAVVGETNDGYLNDIRGRHVQREQVVKAITLAASGPVAEGNVGAGTGTVCFGFKGGIGTASRKLPASAGGYTVGVLVQTNFGGVLQINGFPVGQQLGRYFLKDALQNPADGSCMVVVATDAPIDARNLGRLAKRAFLGIGKTGGIASNGSGDFVIAFSTAGGLRISHEAPERLQTNTLLVNDAMSPLFLAAIEATEEAIYNSLFMASDMKGAMGHKVEALPLERVLPMLQNVSPKK